MTLLHIYNPLTSRREMETGNPGRSYSKETGNGYPAVNIFEEEKRFHIEVAVPGYSKKDISINIDKEILTIASEHESNIVEGEQYTHCEYIPGPFERSFVVGKSIDTDKIEAEYRNGILHIYLAKRSETQPKASRRINIE